MFNRRIVYLLEMWKTRSWSRCGASTKPAKSRHPSSWERARKCCTGASIGLDIIYIARTEDCN